MLYRVCSPFVFSIREVLKSNLSPTFSKTEDDHRSGEESKHQRSDTRKAR